MIEVPAAQQQTSPTGRALFRLLVLGLVAWTVFGLVWWIRALAQAELEWAVLLFMGWSLVWNAGYLPGGVALALYGFVGVARRHLDLPTFLWAVGIYFFSAPMEPVANRLLASLPPEVVQSRTVLAFGVWTGLLRFLCLIAGLRIAYPRRHQSLRRTAYAVLLPLVVGVSLWMVAFGATVLGSSAWRTQALFSLSAQHLEWQRDGLRVEATLDLAPDGAYAYEAWHGVRFPDGHGGATMCVLQWLDGTAAGPQRVGRYPLRLTCNGEAVKRMTRASLDYERTQGAGRFVRLAIYAAPAPADRWRPRKLLREATIPVPIPDDSLASR